MRKRSRAVELIPQRHTALESRGFFHEAFLSLRLNLMDFEVIVYSLKLYVLSQ